MPRALKFIPESLISSALWVLALTLAALVGSPYFVDSRQEFPYSGMSVDSRTH
jgi:hypothetical protein